MQTIKIGCVEMSDTLQALRLSIDEVDTAIIDLLSKRFELTKKVGYEKSALNIDAVDRDREDSILKKWSNDANQKNINEEMAKSILQIIIDQVVKEHKAIKANTKS